MAWRAASAVLVLLMLATALVPLGTAGTKDAPELTDPPGDTYAFPAAPMAGPLADAMDLTAVWLEETPDAIRFSMQVVDLEGIFLVEANPAGDGRWWVSFEVDHSDGTHSGDEQPWDARVFVSQGTVWRSGFAVYDPRDGGSFIDVVGGIDLEASVLWLEAPKSVLDVEEGGELSALSSRTGTYFPSYPSWIGDDGTDGEASFTIAGGPSMETPAPTDAPAETEKESSGPAWTSAIMGLLLAGHALRHRKNRGQ